MEMDDAAVAVCPQVSGNDGYLLLPEIGCTIFDKDSFRCQV